MAKNYQINQKTSTGTTVLHPETNADVVIVNVEGIEAQTASGAFAEINSNIAAITGGGVVTGVKGDAETTYRLGQVNITKANIGLGNVDNVKQYSASNPPPYPVTSVAGKTGAVTLAKSDVGLGNVDNTSDANKPVSTAQQAALDLKLDKTTFNTWTDGHMEAMQELALEVDNANSAAGSALTDAKAYTDQQITAIMGDGVEEAYNSFKEIQDLLKADDTATKALVSKVNANEENISSLQDTVDEHTSTINSLIDGEGGVMYASNADKLSIARKITLSGDATGETTFDGSADKTISVTLANSGVTAGSYSAVTVDAKGRVTAGSQVIEVGATGQTSPSANLAIGGLFLKAL